MKFVVNHEGENFVHTVMWMVAERQIKHAKSNPDGAQLDDLAAMVFVFHAFEAYLNFVGSKLDPIFWKDERKHFRTSGFRGKVTKIFELCGLAEPDRTKEPYKTVWDLKTLRDLIAHGHIQSFTKTFSHHGDEEIPLIAGVFDEVVSSEKAANAIENIHLIAKMLHSAAKPKTKYIWFGSDPFENVHGYASQSTTIIP